MNFTENFKDFHEKNSLLYSTFSVLKNNFLSHTKNLKIHQKNSHLKCFMSFPMFFMSLFATKKLVNVSEEIINCSTSFFYFLASENVIKRRKLTLKSLNEAIKSSNSFVADDALWRGATVDLWMTSWAGERGGKLVDL